ncbi:pyridoxamine 5'-phosphate oxidase family protein [Methylobacillus flagellatus]|uniref:Pyridoxamine 5'-phosphate oxidase-related, FMN-binding protein n=1 Tax=Methylobacillus flagellatus (strain ATCC 51484 / DSM 6875 / VKM B-1610 / KT) TaxID=265072 RepID=Q1GYB8_METFK|nr:pyridoxamine 5'-phosphate oxidase family protein [Methylobacillus flagellatus]ABE50769.1 pyridoxamine 5'-phosphate oxidase-related, FMN-binding protein [Methylobacillus flagellatus KT]
MSEFYGAQHRQWQEHFDGVAMADRVRELIVLPSIPEEHAGFIGSRDFFFLSTIDHRGFPTCSYKGGQPGFVKILDDTTLAFPSLDGNSMYLSMGNLSLNPKIGMLFIDFETPHRIRVHGTASVKPDDTLLAEYQEAELIVRIKIEEIFVNCPRYIHKHQRVQHSPYVPQAGCTTRTPQWKRLDSVQDVLRQPDLEKVSRMGGPITIEEYMELVLQGDA